MNEEVLWNKILKKLEKELSSLAYTTWFSDSKLYKIEDNVVYIEVPMEIHKKHLRDNYKDLIVDTFFDET